jgi:hypothetical protein
MKNSIEVEKYRVSRGLNLLARQIVEQEYTSEMIKTQIEEKFHNFSKTERMGLVREVINRSYRYAWSVPENTKPHTKKKDLDAIMPREKVARFANIIDECVAMKLAAHVVSALTGRSRVMNGDGSFSASFYRDCLSIMQKNKVLPQIDDIELLEIYLKQMGYLIRKTSVAGKNAAKSVFNGDIIGFYSDLFLAFWERASWEDIFPSNPVASRELSQCKSILIDLIARQQGKFVLRELCNEFFSLTGFSFSGDMFMISFLDFYFFTWLSHFGILAYCRPVPEVCMKVTPFGKEFLAHLQQRA